MVTPNLENTRDDGYMAFQEGYSKDVNPWAQDGEDWGFHLAWQAGWEGAFQLGENGWNYAKSEPESPWFNDEGAFHISCGCDYGEGPCGKHR